MNENRPKLAIITGGTGGIGSAIAGELAKDGRPVAFTYNSNTTRAEEVAAKLESQGSPTMFRAVNGLSAEATRSFIGDAAGRFGGIDSLIYASSPFPEQRFMSQIDPAHFADVLQQDVGAFVNFVHASLPMLRDSGGNIVAVTTVATVRYPVRDSLSSGPKGAVEALVRAIAAEEGRFGVRANSVGPGILSDGLGGRLMDLGQVDKKSQESALVRIPLRRFGTAREIAHAVSFLVSDKAAYITGQKLDVDGGYSV